MTMNWDKKLPWYRTPKGRYMRQKFNAKVRNISWEFTFDSWKKLWDESGQYEKYGLSKGHYCMCRYGDIGPYSPENCYIDLASVNACYPKYKNE